MLGRLALVPDLSGALWLPQERTLVVADLHLEKGSAYAARGVFLPPYDSAATLAALPPRSCVHAPARVIALGDSFHDRAAKADRARIPRGTAPAADRAATGSG
jgi:metallophosphoesterase superfamily enzyme